MDERVAQLERLAPWITVHGTQITRVLCDVEILKRDYGIAIPRKLQGEKNLLVWSVGIGPLVEPKVFVYGITIDQAMKRMKRVLKEAHANGQTSQAV